MYHIKCRISLTKYKNQVGIDLRLKTPRGGVDSLYLFHETCLQITQTKMVSYSFSNFSKT